MIDAEFVKEWSIKGKNDKKGTNTVTIELWRCPACKKTWRKYPK